MVISADIRGALRAARRAHRPRMLQSNVAAACGVSVQTVRNWESGRTSPRCDQLDRWADAVGMKTNETD